MGVGRRRLALLWALALTLACAQHTGQARNSAAELSFEHPDLPPAPQGPGGTALRGVTIHPPLRTAPVVRALNAAHGGRACSTWGDFHYKTFDGDVFRFPGLCNYVFSAHCGSAYEDFNLQLRRGPGPNGVAPSRVTMKLDGLVVRLTKGSVLVNGRPIQLPFSQSGVLIEQSNSNLKVVAKLGLVFMWNQDDSLLLELDAKYTNQTCGLCGDFNGVPVYNEFFSHNVKLTPTEFGNLQKMDGPMEQCQDPVPEDAGTCSNDSGICEEMLSSEPFLGCARLVNTSSYLEACRHDLCHCSRVNLTSCLCHTLAEYSRQCAHAGGLPLDWRGPQLCPQTCPLNMRYHECGSPCADTCSNPGRSQLCEDHCVAGCFCPEGMVLDDISHAGCVPVSGCSCVYNGATYAPGTGYSTGCTNCTCSGGRWTCQEAPCPGTCSVLGGAHISTFDEKQYRVHGDCSYVLAKPCDSGAYAVLAELRRCGLTDSETCLKSLTLSLGHTVFVVKASGEVFVNQIYTQLPVSAANVTLFRPSTFFIIAQTQLGLQLDIQLVPIMQVFVRLGPQTRGQSCGLCGNFNQNQADDFLTISGVVEGSAAAFANTWKTQAACPNVKNSFEDPCSLSVENEKYAQHWCSRLTDPHGPFAQCHSAVDPSTHYSNCLFDTCNCEKSEDCMCAALSSYVRACAARGVLLSGWRDGVCTKPMATCPKSLTYRYNISTCLPTCRARSDKDVTCSIGFVPVDGCTCPDGTFLDDAGACVPATSCPCYFQGSVVPNGESLHEQGIVCSCTQGTLTCIGGHTPDPVCLPPMVYVDCRNATPGASGAGCQKSCHTLDMDCYSTKCEPGCVCPDGLVASGDGGCVPVSACPCVHNEASYQPGQTIRVGCNTCTCQGRAWQCTNRPCLATCAVYGDGHYLTFDGRRYSFSGDCEYTLLQDHCGGNGSAQDSFRVVTENVPCGTTGTTCSKAIKIFLGSYELKLSDGRLEVIETGPRPPYSIRQMGIYLVVDTEVGLVLLWDRGTSILLRLSPEFKGRVCGLCGNFDDNALNDFTTRSQSVVGDVLEFGNSWKFSPSCPDALAPRDPCTANPSRRSWAQKQCSIINSATFSACHTHVEPGRYYEACVSDACACDSGGDCECFCTAVAAYAQACHEAGVCVSWRTPDICPLFCDYYNPQGWCQWHYRPCGAPCLKTCRNPSGQCWHDTRGLEGCYPECPAEAPIFDEDQMRCVASCPPPSLQAPCHVGGQSFWPNSTVPSDRDCYSCVCTEGGVQCAYDANACVCTYNGRRFHLGDVIYYTTDGLGGCISARCGANGTIERGVHTCSPTTPTPQTTFSFSTSLPAPRSSEPSSPEPTTVTCLQVLCNWTEWIDGSYPGSGRNSGDFDTISNLRAKGYKFCAEPKDVQCRAESFPDTPLQELGQDVICNKSVGLICRNKDQLPPICYNYNIRFLCCELVDTCRTNTTSPATPATTQTPTAEASTTWATGTLSTSTKLSTASSPHVTPSRWGTPSTHEQSSPGTTPCKPKCRWTKWLDVDFPVPGPHGGDNETFGNIMRNGDSICHRPESISKVECRAENHPGVSIHELGQLVQCHQDVGLLCRNQDQKGKTRLCLNYQIRVLCCEPREHCPPPTVTVTSTSSVSVTVHTGTTFHEATSSATPVHTSSTTSAPTTSPTPVQTSSTTSVPTTSSTSVQTSSTTSAPTTSATPVHTSSTTSVPTTSSTSVQTSSTTSTPTTSATPVHTSSATSAPTTSIISVQTSSATSAPTTSPTSVQTSSTTSAPTTSTISVQTSSTTSAPTTSPTSVQRSSTTSAPTTSPTSVQRSSTTSAPTTSPTSVQRSSTTSAPTTSSTPVHTSSTASAPTTSPTPVQTSSTASAPTTSTISVQTSSTTSAPTTSPTPVQRSSTTSAPTTSSTSVHTSSTNNSTTISSSTSVLSTALRLSEPSSPEPSTVTCLQVLCNWTEWIDGSYPGSGRNSGDFDTISNLRAKGYKFCAEPKDVQCRAESFPDTPLQELGQDVICNKSVGLICRNKDQLPPICYNYNIRFLCCELVDTCRTNTTSPATPATTQTPTAEASTTWATGTLSTSTKLSTASSPHVTPSRWGTPSTHEQSSPGTTPCKPKCRWTKWLDVDFPVPGPLGGDNETFGNIMRNGDSICHRPESISKVECRAENHPGVSIHELGQLVQCHQDVGLLCRNQDQKGKTRLCLNYQIRVLCCEPREHCPPPTVTVTSTSSVSVTVHTGTTFHEATSSATSVHTSSTTSAPTTSTTPVQRSSTTSAPTTSSTSVQTSSTTSAPTTSPTSVQRSSTTSAPTTSTISVQTSSATSAPTTSPTSVQRSSTTSAPTTSVTPVHTSSTTLAPTISSNSVQTSSTTSVPTTSSTSVQRSSTTSAPTTSVIPVHTSSTTSAPTTSTISVQTSSTTSAPTTSPTPVQTSSTTSAPTTSSTSVQTSSTTSTPTTSVTPVQTSSTTSAPTTSPTPVQTSSTTSVPTTSSTSVQTSSTTSAPTTSPTPVQTSSTTSAPTTSPTSVPTSETTPSPRSTVPCSCSVSGQLHPAGSFIYQATDLSGHCYYAFCNPDCHVVKGTAPTCPTSMPPPTPPATTSVPLPWCPNAVPPRTKGETWPMPNCSEATCQGNGVITVSPRHCPRVQKPTCANGYPAVQVTDHDGCCSHYQCPCVCSGWGDPHYITFDGTYYTFLDNCTYVLVQQIVPVFGHFRVLVENYFCDAEDGLSCPQSIIVEYHENRVMLTRKPVHGVMTNEIIFNGEVVRPGFQKGGIAVSQVGIKMYVSIPKLGVQVMFSGLIFSVEVPFSKFANNTEGQCGTCTNDQKDECRLPGGTVVASCSDMSGHWKVTYPGQPSCHGPPPTPGEPGTSPTPCPPSPICQLILSKPFEQCHVLIPPWPYYQGCTFDQCHMPGTDMVCTALELYAALCASLGVCVDWRGHTNSACPFTCPVGMEYWPCGPPIPSYCYTNNSASPLALLEASPITEGCFCPQGTMLYSSSKEVCVLDCNTCDTRYCPEPEACPKGSHAIQTHREAACCPTYNCSWTACSINGTLYQPGAVVSSSLCEKCWCELPGGALSDTFLINCETQICSTSCPVGFKYQARARQCCGECVQVACVMNTSNSSAHLFYPGESWSDPGDHCVTHECEQHRDGLVVVTTKKACPPLNCPADKALPSEDGCCLFCPPHSNRSTCAVHHQLQVLRQQGCSSPGPVRLAYCRGNCGDTTSAFSPEANAVEHRCSCCRELRFSLRNVTLHCKDGSSRALTYTEVEECGCEGLQCDSPGGLGLSAVALEPSPESGLRRRVRRAPRARPLP
ncbi:mucin-5AC isoform X1 [Bos javanicus]|uniref:mucin-5AC isoform X1 n=1 Tax=Bos javanicus TaxID=9906 RepID=UPI002AA83916|nr:mucin-5AC isoform X1 [Bos javanicus]